MKNRKIVLVLLPMLVLSMFFAAVNVEPAKAAIPLDPTTIPKYVTPLLANVPVYLPTNVTGPGRVTIRQDYYVNVTQFTEQVLPAGFPVTTVWGYGGVCYDALTGANLGYIRNSPSPTFIATRGIPTKVTWVNNLTTTNGALLNYLYPVDPTFDWANPNNIPVTTAIQQAGLGLAPPYPPGYNGSAIAGTNPNAWNANSPVPISTHVHGAEVFSGSDGGPNQWFTPNGLKGMDYYTYEPTYPNAAVYYYNNTQEAATLWYHDHAMGLTRINVFSGLAGYYILKDPADTVAPLLPSGAYDIPLAIQDRAFYSDGSFRFDVDPPPNPNVHPYWVPEYFGNTFMVNGNTWPYLNVNQTSYKFRLLDGCNARFLNLSIVDLNSTGTINQTVPFTLVARDQGYMKSPVSLTNTLIGPGMRAEIVVNFTGIPTGHKLLLKNSAAAPYPTGLLPLTGLTDEIMMFVVGGADAKPQFTLPATLNAGLAGAWPTLPASSVTNQRTQTLTEVMGPGGPLAVLIDGQHFMTSVTELPVVGTTENWVITNPTADAHPMHWHLVQFQLVSRQPFDDVNYKANWTALNGVISNDGLPTPAINLGNLSLYYTGPAVGAPPEEQAWLDTVTVMPGEVTTVRIRYLTQNGSPYPFDAAAGPGYVWHCHIVDHEDNDMMRRQTPIQPSQLPPLVNVIKSATNQIQYRIYDQTTKTWNPLVTLPSGTTSDTPAAVVSNGRLYIAVRGDSVGASAIYFGSVNLTTNAFSGWTSLGGLTPSAPTLTTSNDLISMVVRGSDNTIWYRSLNTTTSAWTTWKQILAGATSDKPSAALIGDKLYLVVRATAPAASNMWFSSVNLTSNAFSGWTFVTGAVQAATALTQVQKTNALKLVVTGTDNSIWINSWDGQSWLTWTQEPVGHTTQAPTAAIINSNLYYMVIATDGTTLAYSSLNLANNAFSSWQAATGSATSPPTITR